MQTTELAGRAATLATRGSRRILGIAGPPGAGKSTLAARLAEALGPETAVVVPMDGFHLAQAELARTGLADRKGAPDTFDVAGYVSLLRRLRGADGATVYAPAFDRSLEEPIAGSIPVTPCVPLVITEGNYLLHDAGSGRRYGRCWTRPGTSPRTRTCGSGAWSTGTYATERTRRTHASGWPARTSRTPASSPRAATAPTWCSAPADPPARAAPTRGLRLGRGVGGAGS